ncbi:putative oxygenase MesX, partial [Enterobacter hormaechei]
LFWREDAQTVSVVDLAGAHDLDFVAFTRIVRGQTLSLKRKEFIEAAQVGGVSTANIVVRHIVPNVLASWDNPKADRYAVELEIISVDMNIGGDFT